ncbi:glycosyltransferase [Citricoccus nitrophenolicus]|uniref:Glycosyltransferase n=2 Tax=Citricoccus nitrophenolicus TaxID=863575 RepID=A0ABV0IHR8_9MICC
MDHLKLQFKELNYIDSADNSFSTLVRSPLKVLAAEQKLRTERPSDRTRVILSRRASPFSNGAAEEKLLRNAGLGIYDFDDSIMSVSPEGTQRIWSISRAWNRSVRAADIVIAGNDYLANAAAEVNSNVVVIPSCVELADYQVKTDYTIEDPAIVWIGSPSTEKYLLKIAQALLRVHEETGARLRVISSGSASLGPLEVMVDRISWRPDTYSSELASADVGIMPLPDNEWSRGKCAYKLLQYGAAALPMVGSPVGANRHLLEASNALGPENVGEWTDSLLEVLALTTNERALLGRTARSVIEADYSFDAWSDSWSRAVQL